MVPNMNRGEKWFEYYNKRLLLVPNMNNGVKYCGNGNYKSCKTPVYTALPLAPESRYLKSPTKCYVETFNSRNQHNILVVRILLFTAKRIYWSGWWYDRQSFARQFSSSLWHRFAASGSTPSLFNFLGPGRQQQSNMQTANITDARLNCTEKINRVSTV